MAEINRSRISRKIYKQLNKKGLLKEIRILRCGLNAFSEKLEDLYVCTIKGYCYKKESKIVLHSKEAATINSQYNDKLLIPYDEESKKIKQDDYFVLDDIKFKIISIDNIQSIVFDMYLNRM